MPRLLVRPFEDRDREAFFHVRAMTYNDGKSIPPEEQVFKTTSGFVGEVDGCVSGVFGTLDFTCTRGSALLKCAAVAGVAVLPEARRTGVGSEMMSWGLRHFRESGIPVASLYAFRETYYRKFGYEACGSRVKITVPNSCYPKLKPCLEVRKISQENLDEIKPCYNEFACRRSGMNLRTDKHWTRVLGKDTAIYVAGSPAEAYLLVNHEWQFWQGQSALEFIWTTQAGYEAILSVLAGIGINKSGVEWYEPSDGPYLHRYLDHGVKADIERLVMYRVTDVPATLSALSTQESGEFTLAVRDEVIPENNGPWRVAFSPQGVSVEKASSASIRMDVRQFVQAFLGEPSVVDLGRNGMLDSNSPKDLQAMARLLPDSPTYCTDFF